MMRLLPRTLRTLGPVVTAAALLSVLLVLPATQAFAQSSCVTTIQGKVYSPAGPPPGVNGVYGDPIPNILVFAYPTTLAAFPLNTGPGGCTAQANLVPQTGVMGAGTTDAAGNFTFSTNSIPSSVNIVIQAGKWRRQYPGTAITQCTTNTLPSMAMPASQSQGDLPHIAVVTGDVDGAECIFNQIGIAASEVTTPSGSGSINLYKGGYMGGQVNPDTTATNPTPSESALVSSYATMNTYDVVMFACQGGANQPLATATNQANILNYTSNGGRVFATHWEYIWLVDSFPTVATFGTFTAPTAPTIATIDQSYGEGAILAQWIQNVNASYNNTLGQISLSNTFSNAVVKNPPAQSWVNANSGNQTMQFTFDTPVGQTGVPSVAISYTNNTTSFKPGDVGDTVTINVQNSSTTATLPGLTLTVSLPNGITATSLADSSGNSGWICSGLVCTLATPLAVGATDSATLTFNIASTIGVGSASITSALSGGGLSGTGQCGRVLYNDYHVEAQNLNANTTYLYPSKCSGAGGVLNAQEKFLEFSLYNLSNFVSPTSSDVITVQGTPTITWAHPSDIYYGTALSTTQLNATATYNGATVQGTFVYTPALGTILNVTTGTQQLCVTFTPTDTTDYSTPPQLCVPITVQPDATTTTLPTPVTPIYYGQTIAQAAIAAAKAVSTGPAAINTGTLTFYIGTTAVAVCTLQAANPGTCPATTGAGYNVGTYTVQACYADTADLNFTGSCSPVYNVVVQPDPVAITFPTPATPIYYGQTIAQASIAAATVASTGPASINTGTFTIAIGTPTTTPVVVCSLPATNVGKCPATTGSGYNAGTYTVQACYADTADANFTSICSPLYTVVVQPDPTSAVLTSGADPSTPNQLVPLTVQIVDQYATATGTVQFYDNSGATPLLLGTAPVGPTGTATLSTSSLIVGTHNISACLVASLNFLASSPCGTVVQLVILVPAPPLGTVTLLTSSANPAVVNQSINFSATVATTGAFPLNPGGNITFFDGTTPLATKALDATGSASFPTSTLTVGTHPISAVYAGNSTFATSTSQTIQQVVLVSLPSPGNGFLLKVAPTTLSVGVGSTATVGVTVLSLNNYNQAVQLTCTGLPVEATCTFGQSLIPVGGGTTTMTIAPSAPHACGTNSPYFIATGGFPTTLPLISLTALTLFLVRRRRRLFQGLTLAAALLLLPVLNGCSSACTDFGTQPGTYTFTVTATSTGSNPSTQTQTLQINVHI